MGRATQVQDGHAVLRYTIMAKDRYGCATRRGKGTCENSRTIDRRRIETRVLGGIKEGLLAPELVADFVRAYAEEIAAAEREAGQQRARAESELADVDRRLSGVVSASRPAPSTKPSGGG